MKLEVVIGCMYKSVIFRRVVVCVLLAYGALLHNMGKWSAFKKLEQCFYVPVNLVKCSGRTTGEIFAEITRMGYF